MRAEGSVVVSGRWSRFALKQHQRSKESFGEHRRTGWFAFAGRHRSCRSGLGLCRFEAGEQHQVVRHHRGPEVGLEVIEAAPGAAGQTVGSLEAGDPGLDPGAEVAQLAIDPAALDYVFDRQAALFVKGDILDAARLGRCEIVPAGITAIGGDLPRRHAATGDLALEHGQEALSVGGVAGLDDDIEDQAAPVTRLSLCRYRTSRAPPAFAVASLYGAFRVKRVISVSPSP